MVPDEISDGDDIVVSYPCILDTSCNTHSLKILMKYGVQINNKLQNVCGMNIYPMIIQGKNQHTGKQVVSGKTFWVHHGNMSWMQN